MTREEIDVLWQQALRDSVQAGEMFTRYRFAELVAAAEREECAKVCESIKDQYYRSEGFLSELNKTDAETGAADCAVAIRARETK